MAQESAFDIGVRCDYLLTLAGGSGQVDRDAFIGISGGQIAGVGPWIRSDGRTWSARRLIHARDQVVLPGLINGHTHLAMTLLRGLADDLPFTRWLHDYILPTERKLVSAEFVRIGTELAALECLLSGTTTVCDMYFFGETVAETLDRAGMRAMIGQALTVFPTPDNPDGSPEKPYEMLDRIREQYRGNERIIPMIAPHAPYSCTDEMLRRAGQYSAKNSCPLVIHVAETRAEVQESRQMHGRTPVRRLHELGVMASGRAIFAHCVHVDDEDIGLMAAAGASAIYNPESNMKLGVGIAPIPRLLERGVRVGIGTDGAASNNDLSLFKEMDMGAKLQKLGSGDNTAVTALQALRMATIEGARALGLGDRTGSLEVGKSADMIAVDLRAPHMQPVHNLLSLLVYSATGQEVRLVIGGGRLLVEDGRALTLDPERIRAEVSGIRDRIQASLS